MKKLSEICKRLQIKDTSIKEDYEINGIEINSKKIKKGYLYVVTEGNEKYIREAIQNGAVCLLAEKMYTYPTVVVCNVRKSLSLCCSDFFDNPEKNLKIIGVIGTNGKTSIVQMLRQIISPYKRVATIGTLGIQIGEKKIQTDRTTPDPPELFYYLREAENEGIEYVLCEITAHAIYYEKFYGIRCEMCVFTNISQDHLDFFRNMDEYSAVKTGFFQKENMKIAIVNADDPFGLQIINMSDICTISYGLKQPSDVFAIDINNKNGLKFIINAFDDIIYAYTRFDGIFNVYNILASVSVARLIGISPKEIQTSLHMMSPIEGRLNIISAEPKVVVDFAHTPDGLRNVLETLKNETKGKLIAVYGCGGNRDKTKRPIMAKIGSEIADVCIFTSDNPREEDENDILSDMVLGITEKDNYIRIADRTQAIAFAIQSARKEDCVVVCGKGGEKYIEKKGEKIPYDDTAVCKAVLETVKCRNY